VISRLTKVQLTVFVIVTLIGGAFVGGRYAQLDRLLVDRTFAVDAQFSDSGGIFEGAEVTYRGIGVGSVGDLAFDEGGVRVRLDIDDDAPRIPSDVLAVVANKSVIGEQYVDLQPRVATPPYLHAGDTITQANTRIPISTTDLLIDVDALVGSVDTASLRTVVEELGQAFEGTGQDLATILDTSMDFINEADANLDVTRSLIRESSTVLQTQIDKRGQIGSFSRDLALLSDTLVDADPDLRRLLDDGSTSARTLREVVDENSTDLSTTVRNLLTTVRPISENVAGLQAIFVLYPDLLEGSFTVTTPSSEEGEFDAAFGLVLTPTPLACTYQTDGGPSSGYRERRAPEDIEDVPLGQDLGCDNDTKVPRSGDATELNRTGAASARPSDDRKDSLAWLLLGPTAAQ